MSDGGSKTAETKSESPFLGSRFLTNFVAGGTAASIAVTAMAPLERVKLVLQTQNGAVNILPEQRYTGMWNCFTRFPQEQGYLSYWRGNMASVIRCFPHQALNFALKDKFRDAINKKTNQDVLRERLFGNLLAGGLAGSCALAIIYPLDFARTKMAMDIGKKGFREIKTIRACLMNQYSTTGFQGLYQGFSFSILGVFIYRAFYFGLYDTFSERFPKTEVGFWYKFFFAELSATTAGLISYPLDTVRRSMMLQSGTENKRYINSMDCVIKILRTEGVRGFFHGALTNVLRGTGGAITLILYDHFQQHLMGRGSLFQYNIASRIPHEENLEATTDLPKQTHKKPCIFKDGRPAFSDF